MLAIFIHAIVCMFVAVYHVNLDASKTRGKFEIFEKLVIKLYLRKKYTGILSNGVVTVYTALSL